MFRALLALVMVGWITVETSLADRHAVDESNNPKADQASGHLFITLASILRIPVYMHNVAADRVFRPSAWNAFGTDCLEAADFRACENFGPLYGRA